MHCMNGSSPNARTPDMRQHILEAAKPLMLGKGFTAVGLTELLAAARVPKGSFYHYFPSKEAFGDALLSSYFSGQLVHLDALLDRPGTAAERLMSYWQYWLDTQGSDDPEAKCLAVKLSAEVCDLSEGMRATLQRGIHAIIGRLARCIDEGKADGSLSGSQDAELFATTLYQTWLGASLLAKVTRGREPLEIAMTSTRQSLGLSGSAG
jgi:TetR/AcrR family transcriptional regulator, transcriptional repressor for nem operon